MADPAVHRIRGAEYCRVPTYGDACSRLGKRWSSARSAADLIHASTASRVECVISNCAGRCVFCWRHCREATPVAMAHVTDAQLHDQHSSREACYPIPRSNSWRMVILGVGMWVRKISSNLPLVQVTRARRDRPRSV